MSDEKILQIRFRRVGVVSDEDDDYHTENVRDVCGQKSECKEEPNSAGELLVFCEDECDERGGENSEGINSRTGRRDDNGYLNTEVFWSECQAGGRLARDRVELIAYPEQC